MVPAMVGVLRGGWSKKTDSSQSRTRSSAWSRMGRRMSTEGVQGSFLWNLTRRRSCRDHIHFMVEGRLSNLVCFGCKFSGILDILSHQVGVDVLVQVVEEEVSEHEAFSLVGPMIHRERTTHLAHHGGWLLFRRQGEEHQSLVPLEGVQGVEFREAFHEGLIWILNRRELNEIYNLGGVSTVKGPHRLSNILPSTSSPSTLLPSTCSPSSSSPRQHFA